MSIRSLLAVRSDASSFTFVSRAGALRGLGLALGIACLPLVGACTADATGEDDASESAEDALTAKTVTKLTLNRSTGFVPPPAPGKCRAAGTWTVDFDAATIDANACVDETPVAVQRALTPAEIAKVRSAVAAVRVAPKPAACPTDVPSTSLTIERKTKTYEYQDQRSACYGTARPVTNATIAALYATLESLTPPNAANTSNVVPVGASTCDGKPCFSLKGSCVDATSSGNFTSYANIGVTYVTLDQLAWRDEGVLGTSTATARLFAWLRNYRTIVVDGTERAITVAGVHTFVTAKREGDEAITLRMRTSNNSSWCTLSAELQAE